MVCVWQGQSLSRDECFILVVEGLLFRWSIACPSVAVMEIYSRVLDCQPSEFTSMTTPPYNLEASSGLGSTFLGHYGHCLLDTVKKARSKDKKRLWSDEVARSYLDHDRYFLEDTATDALSPKHTTISQVGFVVREPSFNLRGRGWSRPICGRRIGLILYWIGPRLGKLQL